MSDDSQRLLEEGERLLLAAFHQARRSGRPDWWRMRTTVLKNRLLTETDRRFTETRWGVEKFTEFLALFPDLVSVDSAESPPAVELRRREDGTTTEELTAAGTHPLPRSRHERVRSDLWRAVLDYSSGAVYVWDPEAGRAVIAEDPADDRPRLPTVDPEVMAGWRQEFAAEQAPSLSSRQQDVVDRWRAEGGRTAALPSSLRGLWNAQLKQRVVQRLEEWFAEQHLDTPADILMATFRAPLPPAALDTERLREFAHRTISAMTRAELEALLLPAAAIVRARTDRAGD